MSKFSLSFKNNFIGYICIFVLFCPLFPTLLPGYMGEQLILAFTFVFSLFYISFFCNKKIYLVDILVPTYALIQLSFGVAFDSIRGVTMSNDFFEIPRPIIYFTFYMVFRYTKKDISSVEKEVIPIFIKSFIIISIYTFLDLFVPQVKDFSLFLYNRYSDPGRVLYTLAVGTVGATYTYAFILLLPLIYSVYNFLLKREIKSFIILLILLSSLLLAQSKSMYICFGTALIVICFDFLTTTKDTRAKTLIVTIIASVVLGVILSFEWINDNFTYAVQGFEAIVEGNSASSGNRINQIVWAFRNSDTLLFGSGIGKSEILLESFYSLYPYRLGLIFVLVYLFIILKTSVWSFKISKYFNYGTNEFCFYRALFAYYLIFPIAVLSSAHQDTPKVAFFFYGFIGLIVNRHIYLKKNSNTQI